jgi:multiple sugar transport system ATP-binding protein
MLMDEPFGALDPLIRDDLAEDYRHIHAALGLTTIFVTHDMTEAMLLGDRIAVMKDGEVRQLASPQEVYDNPADLFVASFIGSPSMNFIRCPVVADNGAVGVQLHEGAETFVMPAPGAMQDALRGWIGKDAIMGIRPEQITDRSPWSGDNPHVVSRSAKIEVVQPTGPDTLVLIHLNGTPVTCRVHPEAAPHPGQSMNLMFDLSKLVFFDPKSEKRIS